MKQQSKAVRFLINTLKALIVPVGVWLFFAILSGGRTATFRMLMTTLRQSVTPIIICYGLMLTMSLGMINFSAGAMILFSVMIGGNLALSTGLGLPAIVVILIVMTVVEGVVTGLLYNAMRVPCIVLSIGMMLVWESSPRFFYNVVNVSGNLTILSRSPYCFVVVAICLVLFHVLYNYTAFGHNLRALGSNQAIANSVGLDSDKIKFMAFVLSALFFGIAAVLYLSEKGEVRNQSAMGSMTIMMDGFMGMFIAMFLSKYCNMSVAIILGSFSMKMLSNGFVALGLSSTVRDVVQGFFLLILLVISANSGILERRRADKAFAQQCNEAYQKETVST